MKASKKANYIEFPRYEMLAANLVTPPIIANYIDTSTKEGVDGLNSLLYRRYQNDTLSATPKCNCGELTGGYNKGIVCNICGSVCADVLDIPLESNVWVEVPEGIKKFIAPGMWTALSKALTQSGFNLLEWMVNPRYPDPPSGKPEAVVPELLGLTKEQRNLNFFYDNFESLMLRVVTYKIIKNKPKAVPGLSAEQIAEIYNGIYNDHHSGAYALTQTPLGTKYKAETILAKFVLKYIKQKDRVFSKILPLPSSLGMILETNNSGTWGETSLLVALDAMYAVTQIPYALTEPKLSLKNRRSIVFTSKMNDYGKAFIRDTAGSKEGIFRRHICGGRVAFSMRAVIASINEPHAHDELHLPWVPAVQMFRLMIINKLFSRGFNPKQATKLIDDYTRQYHPLIDEIFKELIAESDGGIWTTFQRSPSIKKGSIQLLRITRVKTNITDRTMSMSINITNSPNADFDGDACHLILILDRKMVKRLQNLRPHRSVLSLDEPKAASGCFKQQAPITLTIQNWVYG